MSRIFVSYRHEDSEADAGRLYDTLAAALGRDALYKDVEDIAIGRSWKRAVSEALADSAAVLFVMGPDWSPSPPIEYELALALASDVPVVPILVRKADLGRLAGALRAPLSEIGERKAVTLSHASWSRDCGELVETLKRVLADPARARVIIEPPDPRALLDEANWPHVGNRDDLLTFAQDLAECLGDPDLRKRAEAGYDRFEEERFDEYYRRHDIPPDLLAAARAGLQRLNIEHYVRELLDRYPAQDDWEGWAEDWNGLASTVASFGELIGDPSLGESARKEVEAIKEEIREMSRSRGDGGDPRNIRDSQATLRGMVRAAKARLIREVPGIDQPGFTRLHPKRVWPLAAFGTAKEYGQTW